MRAGELKYRITIQRPTDTASASGEITQTWSNLATVWSKIEDISGSETWRTAQVDATVTKAIEIRWLATVKPKHRIVYRDLARGETKIFGIEAIIDIPGGHSMACREVVDA